MAHKFNTKSYENTTFIRFDKCPIHTYDVATVEVFVFYKCRCDPKGKCRFQ